MTDADAPRPDPRRRIHDFIQANPGSHLREVARGVGIPLGTALYHLDHLCSTDHVVVKRDGRYKRYFLRHSLGRAEKDLVSALHHAVPRRVASALLARGALTQRELAAGAGVSRSTLSFHVTNLVARGILRRHDGWPENHYALADRELVARILDAYGSAFAREPGEARAGGEG